MKLEYINLLNRIFKLIGKGSLKKTSHNLF